MAVGQGIRGYINSCGHRPRLRRWIRASERV